MAAVRSARRHWAFAAVLLAAVGLRLAMWRAYRPAFEFFQDSYSYLYDAQHLSPDVIRPSGYSVFLRLLSPSGTLAMVSLVQHALGIGMMIAIYALLVRCRVPRALAALATVPVALDVYQLEIEQLVMAETLTTFLLVIGFVLALWSDSPGPGAAIAAGAAFGLGAVTRNLALPLVALPLLYLLVRRRPLSAAVLLAAFAAPVLLYVAWFHSVHGVFALESYDGYFLAGRVAPLAKCSELNLPARYRRFCVPEAAVRGMNWYVWGIDSPLEQLPAHGVGDRNQLARQFALLVIRQQPADYAGSVVSEVVHYFSWDRKTGGIFDYDVATYDLYARMPPIHPRPMAPPPDPYAGYWSGRPTGGPDRTNMVPAVYGFHGEVLRGHVSPTLGRFFVRYAQVAYTRGTVLAISLALALVGAICGWLLRRTRMVARQGAAAGVLGIAGLALLVVPAMSSTFDYRYLLPALPLAPAAGALGLSAVLATVRTGGRPSEDPEPAGKERQADDRLERGAAADV